MLNAEWHSKHRMPRNANLDERIAWHIEHAERCGCRAIPHRVAQEIRRRQDERPRA